MWQMPDMSLIIGNELMAGDSFANLPQNGNDAANLLDARWRKERGVHYDSAVEAAILESYEQFTTCEMPDQNRLYVIDGKVGRLISPQDQ